MFKATTKHCVYTPARRELVNEANPESKISFDPGAVWFWADGEIVGTFYLSRERHRVFTGGTVLADTSHNDEKADQIIAAFDWLFTAPRPRTDQIAAVLLPLVIAFPGLDEVLRRMLK